MSTQFVDYFGQTKYASFRPDYTQNVFDLVVSYAKEHKLSPPFDLIIDVGCGSGQAVKGLATHAKMIVGCDPSEGQIAQAKAAVALPNAEFVVSRAEVLPFLKDNSVDILTAAQCIHWFDQGTFFPEVRRVLKPGGVLAYWGYHYTVFEGEHAEELNAVFKDLFAVQLDKYWPASRKLVEGRYADIPAQGMAHETRIEADMKYTVTLDHFMGYLDTWSAMKEYTKAHPSDPILGRFKAQFAKINGDKPLQINFPVFMVLSTNPK